MSYSPLTEEELKEMLNDINVSSINNLFDIIPETHKYNINSINIELGKSELEVENIMNKIASKNKNASNSLCFMGGGAYDHYVPKIVDTLSSRSEFYTAYTPYQPEVSQGTLQYLYEFQTMLCELSGMEIANASLYDGASAVAEACSLAVSSTRKRKILISATINPEYLKVVQIYFKYRDVDLQIIENINDGVTSIDDIKTSIDDDTACIVIQSPNYHGLLEDWSYISKIKKNALLIAISDPLSMSLVKSPGDSGCDVYVGEGQSLGNYMSFGGPFVGLFATKLKFARKMPGRIIGKTIDSEGKDGYVMTLQTREQHIRRDRATSNICTNQGLLALRCTIYMALMGKKISKIAKICFNNSQYAADEILKLDNFELYYKSRSFIKEFIIKTNKSAKKIQIDASKENILVDIVKTDLDDNLILLAFTEKRTKNDIDKLIDFLKNY